MRCWSLSAHGLHIQSQKAQHNFPQHVDVAFEKHSVCSVHSLLKVVMLCFYISLPIARIVGAYAGACWRGVRMQGDGQ